jgi:hypothetical protein
MMLPFRSYRLFFAQILSSIACLNLRLGDFFLLGSINKTHFLASPENMNGLTSTDILGADVMP